jgi:galactokinase
MPPYSTQEVEDLHLADPDLAVLVVNSEYRHNLAERETEGERDYSSRRKTCEAISKKLGVQWLRDVKWKELEVLKR